MNQMYRWDFQTHSTISATPQPCNIIIARRSSHPLQKLLKGVTKSHQPGEKDISRRSIWRLECFYFSCFMPFPPPSSVFLSLQRFKLHPRGHLGLARQCPTQPMKWANRQTHNICLKLYRPISHMYPSAVNHWWLGRRHTIHENIATPSQVCMKISGLYKEKKSVQMK